ncbi:ferredoxin [Pseudenhygromyxa sp. WMMC2535]|uniref:ferredoxin n=1 Tax=Pseudenhygromyxa sp. WMMC2535 TaxID=2712867 RepID=UPI001555A895|nr:ferredoxin [Pseudenhygromyxa sp. WMMC2535]
MKIVIDKMACEANGICVDLLPEVLELIEEEDEDVLRLRLAVVPAKLEDQARKTVRACPRQALSIEE